MRGRRRGRAVTDAAQILAAATCSCRLARMVFSYDSWGFELYKREKACCVVDSGVVGFVGGGVE
jgi:hypothetical protein